MLRNLHIKNLALIHEVDVDFREGLNILTGETGAGKSIIVDSIGLALGERVRRDMTKTDGSTSIAELVFEVSDPETLDTLRELMVEPEDGVIIVSRVIREGRSSCRVNGETRTSAEVREIASHLLDIHGQSEHQKLLRADRQLELVDEYGGSKIREAKEAVAEDYRAYSVLRKQLGKKSMSEEERAAKISFLEFETQEIENADLRPGEDEELEKRFSRLSNSRRIAEAVAAAHEATGYDGEDSAGEQIGRAVRFLERVAEYDEGLSDLLSQLTEIDGLLNDFNRELSGYAEDLSFEESSFAEVEERLNTLNHLKSKYGRTVEEVIETGERKQEELEELLNYEERLAKLKKEFAAAEEKLAASSDRLTEIRKAVAADFIKEASSQFRDLNFARADFTIEFYKLKEFTAGGNDMAEYRIATNPGEDRKPLKDVVSGGELSRIMLGIRTMFADSDSAETIIFDEVDAGISGRTAQKVAEKLARVSREHQVICITHLPQIAAMADTHYGITKTVGDDSAITNIEPLSERESTDELARLIGGAEITRNTLRSASEMQEMCRLFKGSVL